MRRPAFALLALALAAGAACASENPRRLLLLGGGDNMSQAITRFAAWAGGRRGRILIVPYANVKPEDSFRHWQTRFSAASAGRVEMAVSTATLAEQGAGPFLKQLDEATAVYFTGGDQVRLMGALRRHGLLEPLRRRYSEGVLFGGSSAGTAIMSDPMITGEGDFNVVDGAKVETAEGLGLVPGAIVDQHFLIRQRENRLFGVILAHPLLLGVGVDEPSAVAVTQDRFLEVLDRGAAMIVQARRPGEEALLIEILRPGERYDLRERRRLPRD